MLKKPLIVFFLISLSWNLHAGVASPSFEPVSVNTNPAAAAFRANGGIGFMSLFKNIITSIDTNNTGSLEKDISISRHDLIVAGKEALIVPEVFLSYQKSEKIIKVEDKIASAGGSPNQQTSTNKNSLINNQFNLAFRTLSFLSFGVEVIKPSVSYTDNESFTSGSIAYNYDYKLKVNYPGAALGSVLRLGPIYLGGSFMKVTEKAQSSEGSSNKKIEKTTLGSALVFGNVKADAFRLELYQERFNYDKSGDTNTKGKLTKFETELILKSIYGSFGVQSREGFFIDFPNIMEDILYSERMTEKQTSYFWGVGFRPSTGHGLGIKLSYSKNKGEEKLYPMAPQKYPATTKEMTYGASYSYVF